VLICLKVLFTSATKSEITQSSWTAGALIHGSVFRLSNHLAHLGGLHHWATHCSVSLCSP
jgi:hypothetical protein